MIYDITYDFIFDKIYDIGYQIWNQLWYSKINGIIYHIWYQWCSETRFRAGGRLTKKPVTENQCSKGQVNELQ